MRAKIENAKTKGEEVAITNCSIRKRRGQDEELEIIAGDKSSLIKSPKRFHIDESLLNMPGPLRGGGGGGISPGPGLIGGPGHLSMSMWL